MEQPRHLAATFKVIYYNIYIYIYIYIYDVSVKWIKAEVPRPT